MLLASNKYKVTTQAVNCSTLYNKSGVTGPPRVAKCTSVQPYSSPGPCFRKWTIQWRKMEKSTWEWSSGQHPWEVIRGSCEERELTFPFRRHCQLCLRNSPWGTCSLTPLVFPPPPLDITYIFTHPSSPSEEEVALLVIPPSLLLIPFSPVSARVWIQWWWWWVFLFFIFPLFPLVILWFIV